jgi:hypothetical protein
VTVSTHDDVFDSRANKELPGGAYLEKVGDETEIKDPVNPAEPVWEGIGDNELVAMIESKTGEKVNAGDYAHTELVATARGVMGFDKPARRRGAAASALAGKQGDDRAMGGVPSPTRASVLPSKDKPTAPPAPNAEAAQVKVVDNTAVKVDTKAPVTKEDVKKP